MKRSAATMLALLLSGGIPAFRTHAAPGPAAPRSDATRLSPQYYLYGFKLAQTIAGAHSEFGKPERVHEFPDGHKAHVFRFPGHVAVLQADNTRPDLIWSIQLSGETNPAGRGLGPVNLGADEDQVLHAFGEPDDRRTATDQITGKAAEGIFFWSYYARSNFSLEMAHGKVRSIKITFRPPTTEPGPSPDLEGFLAAVRASDTGRICSALSVNLGVGTPTGDANLNVSCLAVVSKNEIVQGALFGPDGLAGVEPKTCAQVSMRFHADFGPGPVILCKGKKRDFELFFSRSFEGWVLTGLRVLVTDEAGR